MQNIKAVRNLLLNTGNITDDRQQTILESIFDYLVEEGRGDAEAKIRVLMFGLVQEKQAGLGIPLHELTPDAAANVVKAIAYCFSDEFQIIPEIALLNFRVHSSTPTIYRDDKGVHAMIIVTLLSLADELNRQE